MDDIIEYLTAVPAWYLATCEGDQPRVRPLQLRYARRRYPVVLHRN